MDDFQNIFNTLATIIDLGSGTIKAGLSGEENPTCIFPSLIGIPKFHKILPMGENQQIVGPQKEVRGLYRLKKPIVRGEIKDKDDIKLILHEIFGKLKLVNNKEIPVFIAEPPFTSKKQKSMIAEILFDTYDTPNIFFGTQGVLSLYSFGRTDGVVLESGEGVTQVVPVFNGYKLDYSVEKMNFGGIDVSQNLKLFLKKNGISLFSSSENCILEEMKESICQLKDQAIDYKKLIGSNLDSNKEMVNQIEYELPDGSSISVGPERFIAPEILFNPSIRGMEFPGLHTFLDSSIKKLDLDLRKNLYESIILSGGNTLINGFSERLANELEPLVSDKTKLSITAANSDRTVLAWQGASSITNISSFSKLWISKKEHQEEGDRIFLIKNF